MIEAIIRFSVQQKLIIGMLVLALIGGGIYALKTLPVDAVPDITNNQVQIVTVSNSLAPQEVEQFITYPVEVAMANIPNVIEIRSISRYGLSVVTVVFTDDMPMLDARQFVKEQIGVASQEIPAEMGVPELMPITTGLGEVYQYVLEVEPGYEQEFTPMRLRTIQDWIVKRQMAGIPGIIEVSSFGGYLKQYEVALDPILLQAHAVSILQVFEALEKNNQNSGGSYIEKNANAYYIRTEGLIKTMEDIEQIVIKNENGIPVLIRDVANVQLGSPKRFGAMTMDGKGEAVGGIALMLKGGNASEAMANVHERIEEVRKSLPEGVRIYSYLDRSVLVGKTINTVKKNLLEGGLIVIVVLILLLGDLRSGLIVASIIPLAMLFALIMMKQFGVTANLMSLGAIDFGIVVDGAVIIVEGVLFTLAGKYAGQQLSQQQMDEVIVSASSRLFRSAVFGVLIILIVFIPIMTLTGIEGKTFRPMAMTFSFAVLGAMLLSLTYVPMLSALVLSKKIKDHDSFADKLINGLKSLYKPVLKGVLKLPYLVLGAALAVLVATYLLFRTLGAEFIPTLEEGDLAMQMAIQPGSSLEESVKTSTRAEQVLLANFPEIKHVVSKIGTAEVPTDPMAIEDADIMIILKEKEEWSSASNREDLVEKMKHKLDVIPGASFEFTQPIQLRFNELMTGAKTDIAVKIFGENTEILKEYADKAAVLIHDIQGAGDVKVEQTEGLPQLKIEFDRNKVAEYGLDIKSLNSIVRAAYAGEAAGVVFENERKFDLVVRLSENWRQAVDLDKLFVQLDNGRRLPLSEVAQVRYTDGPMQISREGARRRIIIGVNVRNRDLESLVEEIQQVLEARLNLPAGYSLQYGGEFENLQQAQQRLAIAVPLALLLIFFLLYFTFGKLKYALMIFTAVPLSAIGGVIALWLRGMPFSISAGVGFIALFGVAVLNGIVLISHFNRLRYEDGLTDIREVILTGSLARLRPVLMTAIVAALGFLPMAISTSNGAEVQKPLATVVIGGLVTATLLTLLVMPVLYFLVNKNIKLPKPAGLVILFVLGAGGMQAQGLSMAAAVDSALIRHPEILSANLRVRMAQLQMDQARQLPATQFELQAGQINETQIDYNFSARQGLGNIAADKKRRLLAAAEISGAEKQLAVTEESLSYRVRQQWLDWTYRSVRLQKLIEQQGLYQQFRDKAEFQYENGAINGLDRSLANNRLVQLKRSVSAGTIEQTQAWQQLRTLAWIEAENLMPETTLPVFSLPVNTTLNPVLLAPQTQQIAIQEASSRVAEKQLAPEWEVGYFNQSIRPDYSLQGISVGLQLPLFRKALDAQIQESKLEQLLAKQQLELQTRALDNRLQLATQQVQEYRSYLDTSGSELQEQAANVRRLAQLQLEEGAIDFFGYLQSIDAALQSELDYLEILYQYNQSVLELQFLTQQ